ncbi:deleted in malignant brain tumors 1 protein-like [Alligator mississippiensis]|uniref:deleted in malignant brain tumors 1 protein-like n=1 Tax=Alligator mississippiensis TaxID=8496 RepID=UPI002877B72F|nr:deleted in malignant brain tumors 1 protein-like [Alligator mississippiensis]
MINDVKLMNGFTGFRLVNSSTQCSGRVEVQVLGVWGTMCDSCWDLSDAHILCRQLDCGFAVSTPRGGRFGKGTGPVWKDAFYCNGTELHLWHCPVIALGASQCSHDHDVSVICSGHESNLTLCNTSLSETMQPGIAEDVSVVCSGSRRIRLLNGAGLCAGREEVYYQGTWGTICDDSWDLSDANVICRQLRCGYAIEACPSARYGQGSGQIRLDDVKCSGDESELWTCPSGGWGQHNCRHKEDAGVLCSDTEKIRVVGGEDGCSGRVEVWHRGSWGTVCDDSWDMADVDVVCKQLGCGPAVSALSGAAFGEGDGPIWLEKLDCRGTESSLWHCPAKHWEDGNCHHKEDAAVNCSGDPCSHLRLRLVNGSTQCLGRVEVQVLGAWGTMCDSRWDLSDAHVLCRQLDCGFAVSAPGGGHFGRGTGPFWRDTFHCNGTEPHLWHCPVTALGVSQCFHDRDVSVICSVSSNVELLRKPINLQSLSVGQVLWGSEVSSVLDMSLI